MQAIRTFTKPIITVLAILAAALGWLMTLAMVSRGAPLGEQVDRILNNGVLKATVVDGAAAATNIAITGIKTDDKLVAVMKLDFTLAEGTPNTRDWTQADLTSEASITSDGNIQLSTTATTGAILLVFYLDLTP